MNHHLLIAEDFYHFGSGVEKQLQTPVNSFVLSLVVSEFGHQMECELINHPTWRDDVEPDTAHGVAG